MQVKQAKKEPPGGEVKKGVQTPQGISETNPRRVGKSGASAENPELRKLPMQVNRRYGTHKTTSE